MLSSLVKFNSSRTFSLFSPSTPHRSPTTIFVQPIAPANTDFPLATSAPSNILRPASSHSYALPHYFFKLSLLLSYFLSTAYCLLHCLLFCTLPPYNTQYPQYCSLPHIPFLSINPLMYSLETVSPHLCCVQTALVTTMAYTMKELMSIKDVLVPNYNVSHEQLIIIF